MKYFLHLFIFLCILSCKESAEKDQPLPTEPPVAAVTFPALNLESTTGAMIEITGQNLATNPNDNKIKVGGVAVSHVEVIDLQNTAGKKIRKLRTCVPAGAQTGEITLTIGNHTLELGGIVIRTYQSKGNWKQVADFPGTPKFNRPVTLVIGDKVYVGLGNHTFISDSGVDDKFNDFWEYNPADGKWTRKADFPGGNRTGMTAFAIGGKGYVGMGSAEQDIVHSVMEKDLWEYNPATDKWAKKNDFPGGRRGFGICFSLNGRGYMLASVNVAGDSSNDLWEYNPTSDSWRQRSSFLYKDVLGSVSAMSGPVVGTTANNAYLFSGSYADTYGNDYAFYQYNPQSNRWSRKARFIGVSPIESGYNANWWQAIARIGFCIGSRFYLATPSYSKFTGELTPNFFAYDENTDRWSTLPQFTGTPQSSTSFVIGNKGYAGIGLYQKDLWEFTP